MTIAAKKTRPSRLAKLAKPKLKESSRSPTWRISVKRQRYRGLKRDLEKRTALASFRKTMYVQPKERWKKWTNKRKTEKSQGSKLLTCSMCITECAGLKAMGRRAGGKVHQTRELQAKLDCAS